MRFLIPTYQREDVLSLATLERKGIDASDITIGTQTVEDFARIASKYADKDGLTVILKEDVHNVAGNRNQLLEWAVDNGDEFVMMMDDDILEFETENLDESISRSIELMKRYDITLMEWNTHGIDSERKVEPVWMDWNYCGCVNLIDMAKLGETRLDEDFDITEDMELPLRLITSGRHTAFLSTERARMVQSGFNMNDDDREGSPTGGCAQFYDQGAWVADKHFNMLYERYGRYGYLTKTTDTSRKFIWFWSPTGYKEA